MNKEKAKLNRIIIEYAKQMFLLTLKQMIAMK